MCSPSGAAEGRERRDGVRRDEIQSLMSRAASSVPPRVPPQKLLSVAAVCAEPAMFLSTEPEKGDKGPGCDQGHAGIRCQSKGLE